MSILKQKGEIVLCLDIFEIIEYLRSVVDLEANEMRLVIFVLKQLHNWLVISMLHPYFPLYKLPHMSRTVHH